MFIDSVDEEIKRKIESLIDFYCEPKKYRRYSILISSLLYVQKGRR